MNPAAMIKLMNAKGAFEKNHPKFIAFIKAVTARKIEEGTVIEISVQRPGEEPLTANVKVRQDDLELLNGLKELMNS